MSIITWLMENDSSVILATIAAKHVVVLWVLREIGGFIIKKTKWKWDDELMRLLRDGKNARVAMNQRLDKFNRDIKSKRNDTKTTGVDA